MEIIRWKKKIRNNPENRGSLDSAARRTFKINTEIREVKAATLETEPNTYSPIKSSHAQRDNIVSLPTLNDEGTIDDSELIKSVYSPQTYHLTGPKTTHRTLNKLGTLDNIDSISEESFNDLTSKDVSNYKKPITISHLDSNRKRNDTTVTSRHSKTKSIVFSRSSNSIAKSMMNLTSAESMFNLESLDSIKKDRTFQKKVSNIYDTVISPLNVKCEEKETLIEQLKQEDDYRTKRHAEIIQSMDPDKFEHLTKDKDRGLLDRINTFGRFAFRAVDTDDRKDIQTFLGEMKYHKEAKPTMSIADLWSQQNHTQYLKIGQRDQDKRLIEKFIVRTRPTPLKPFLDRTSNRSLEKQKLDDKVALLNFQKTLVKKDKLSSPLKRKLKFDHPLNKGFYHNIAETDFKSEITQIVKCLDELEQETKQDYVEILNQEKNKFKLKYADKEKLMNIAKLKNSISVRKQLK